MARKVQTAHKGAPRRYFCSEYLTDDGKMRQYNPQEPIRGCFNMVLYDGEPIPVCPDHQKRLKKPRFKRVEDKRLEVLQKQKAIVGPISMWPDVARRKALCHLCGGIIELGEDRIAFDFAPPHGSSKALAGGVITRIRKYVHSSCLVDTLYGGEAGEGCPGCSAKILHDEFMSVREMLEKRHAAGA